MKTAIVRHQTLNSLDVYLFLPTIYVPVVKSANLKAEIQKDAGAELKI